MEKEFNITFINSNTEEQMVQDMLGVLAYNLVENDKTLKFDYKDINSYHSSCKKRKDCER